MIFTTLSSWVRMIHATLAASNVDVDRLFTKAGLTTDKLRMPNARYPVDGLRRLWKLAVHATANPSLGLKVTRHWHPTALHAVGYSWMASESLRAAMEGATKYGHLLSTDLRFALTAEPGQAEFSFDYDTRRPEPVDAEIDALAATLLKLCRVTFGGPIQPLSVQLARSKPVDPDPYRRVFGESIGYSADRNAIVLKESDVTRLLPTANADLVRANERLALERLVRLESAQLALRVRREIVEDLQLGGGDQRAIASRLGMSARALQRKLAREGTSYQQVLDEARGELALEYLADNLSQREIAYMLGFSDSSAFAKAFRRWFGTAPTQYQPRAERRLCVEHPPCGEHP